MAENEIYLYHCFPRRQRKDPASELAFGLKILASISRSGFLLTPEITEWQEPLDDGSYGESWKVIQKTCSFTELPPCELPQHLEHFGRFSIEFGMQAFRQLGGIPVFYLPRATDSDVGLESLAAALMARTGEIQNLLNRLSRIAVLVENTRDKNQFLMAGKTGEELPTRCSLGGAEDLIRILTHRAQGVDILRNALRALSAFFCPTEDLKYTGLLAYYQQREWRLIANMSKRGHSVDRDLTDAEKSLLLDLDEEFFGREIKFFTGTHRRADQCRLYSELSGKKVIQYANRIIVPEEAVESAIEELGEDSHIPVVPLGSLS